MSRGYHKWRPEEVRFWDSVDKNGAGGCWLWTGTITPSGYAQFARDRRVFFSASGGLKRIGAHRWLWEHLNGPVPEELVLDHLCAVRHCVNPDHLEAVTQRENVMRSQGITALNARRTECWRGHALEGANLYVAPNGQRQCRTCNRIRRGREPDIAPNETIARLVRAKAMLADAALCLDEGEAKERVLIATAACRDALAAIETDAERTLRNLEVIADALAAGSDQ